MGANLAEIKAMNTPAPAMEKIPGAIGASRVFAVLRVGIGTCSARVPCRLCEHESLRGYGRMPRVGVLG